MLRGYGIACALPGKEREYNVIGNYTNQSLTLKHAGVPNEYNEVTYTTSTIKGRKETGNKLVRNGSGEETVSSAVVFTESPIIEDDLIDGDLVIAVESAVDLSGTIKFYKAWLI